MGRMKKRMWIPNDVKRIRDIIMLFLNTHPCGFNVLCGRTQWPTPDEMREWFSFLGERGDYGVKIQTYSDVYTEQRYAEAGESAEQRFDALMRHGGVKAMRDVIAEYARVYPDNVRLLECVGNAGLPGAKSLEAVAGELCMDVKTLRRRQEAIAEDIACGIYYAADDSFQIVA